MLFACPLERVFAHWRIHKLHSRLSVCSRLHLCVCVCLSVCHPLVPFSFSPNHLVSSTSLPFYVGRITMCPHAAIYVCSYYFIQPQRSAPTPQRSAPMPNNYSNYSTPLQDKVVRWSFASLTQLVRPSRVLARSLSRAHSNTHAAHILALPMLSAPTYIALMRREI